nr:hypothetical protein [Actinomycetota bacterium]
MDPFVRAYIYSLTRSLNVLLPGPPIVREARARARRFAADEFSGSSGEAHPI